MRRLAATLVSIVLVVVVGAIGPPARAATPTPDSMAAIGDSISTAYDACCWYGDHPGNA